MLTRHQVGKKWAAAVTMHLENKKDHRVVYQNVKDCHLCVGAQETLIFSI